MDRKTITPPLTFAGDILRPQSREAVAIWLSSRPTSMDGEPIIAIHQRIFCEAMSGKSGTEDLIPLNEVAARVTALSPVVRHNKGVGDLWALEVTSSHMQGYRDPHFMLSHDETPMRLITSGLPLLVRADGSDIHFYHFARTTLMTTWDLSRSSAQVSPGNVTHILPKVASNHARLAQQGDIDGMTEVLRACGIS